MHIVIMGCGRTGAALAAEFERQGHTVAVIDRDEESFRRLPADFQGQRITGVGFDRDTLKEAGVEEAYGFAAVSSGDNSNILAARVVRETYGVENVVARIADPGRAEVYRRLGIPTVAPVPWTTTQIVSRLLPAGQDVLGAHAEAGVTVRRLVVPKKWVGTPYREMEKHLGIRLAFIVRFAAPVLPDDEVVVQVDDDAYFAIIDSDSRTVDRALTKGPKGAR